MTIKSMRDGWYDHTTEGPYGCMLRKDDWTIFQSLRATDYVVSKEGSKKLHQFLDVYSAMAFVDEQIGPKPQTIKMDQKEIDTLVFVHGRRFVTRDEFSSALPKALVSLVREGLILQEEHAGRIVYTISANGYRRYADLMDAGAESAVWTLDGKPVKIK